MWKLIDVILGRLNEKVLSRVRLNYNTIELPLWTKRSPFLFLECLRSDDPTVIGRKCLVVPLYVFTFPVYLPMDQFSFSM